ncbi:MAG TPA: dTMP kinase [Holosporales bacterium]|nr:dTMP kinase [Holosporales bacterium]
MKLHKAPFITFEGGEGSGKSTQIHILFERLLQMDIDIVQYREPRGTKGAEEIRSLLFEGEQERWSPTSEALLLSAARADLIQKKILPALEGNTWVLCDRYADSTLAYQGFGHELGEKPIKELNRFTIGDLEPDLTFVFQINAEIGLQRVADRKTHTDRFERNDILFHQRVQKGYDEILKKNPQRCIPINALLDIDRISQLIFDEVMKRFKDRI